MTFPAASLRSLGRHGGYGPTTRLNVDGASLAVSGWIAYDDEWIEYLLADGTWLCIEQEDGQTKLSRWWDLPGTAPEPGPTITVQGHAYREVESYRSSWRAGGIGDLPASGQVWVADYASVADPTYLAALEDWGDGPELSLGQVLPANRFFEE